MYDNLQFFKYSTVMSSVSAWCACFIRSTRESTAHALLLRTCNHRTLGRAAWGSYAVEFSLWYTVSREEVHARWITDQIEKNPPARITRSRPPNTAQPIRIVEKYLGLIRPFNFVGCLPNRRSRTRKKNHGTILQKKLEWNILSRSLARRRILHVLYVAFLEKN
jgi:hypothetical protein